MKDQFSTPILLLIFNRPEAVKRLIEHLSVIRPSKIYVGADGPRSNHDGDQKKCSLSQKQIAEIDWPCEVVTNFRKENLGCRKAVSESISWFFAQEESGIILEDDCLPDASFFRYAEELLVKYEGDTQVMHVAGDNPIQEMVSDRKESYLFTSMPLVWGWATWRSAWEKMNLSLQGLESFDFKQLSIDSLSQKYIKEKFEDTQAGTNDSWAYAWYFSILQNKGLCAFPKVNLVRNIGFNADSTHTTEKNKKRELDAQILPMPLVHPKKLICREIDQKVFYAAQKSKVDQLARWIIPTWIRRLFGAR